MQTHFFRHIAHRGEDPQHVEKVVVVVFPSDGAAVVAFWKGLEHFGRDEGRVEERGGRVGHGHCVLRLWNGWVVEMGIREGEQVRGSPVYGVLV